MLRKKLLKLINAFKDKTHYRPFKTSAGTYNGKDVLKAYKHGYLIIDELLNEIIDLNIKIQKYEGKKIPLKCKLGMHKFEFMVDEDRKVHKECINCSKVKTYNNIYLPSITSGKSMLSGKEYTWNIDLPYGYSHRYFNNFSETKKKLSPKLEIISNKKKIKSSKRKTKLEIVK